MDYSVKSLLSNFRFLQTDTFSIYKYVGYPMFGIDIILDTVIFILYLVTDEKNGSHTSNYKIPVFKP